MINFDDYTNENKTKYRINYCMFLHYKKLVKNIIIVNLSKYEKI